MDHEIWMLQSHIEVNFDGQTWIPWIRHKRSIYLIIFFVPSPYSLSLSYFLYEDFFYSNRPISLYLAVRLSNSPLGYDSRKQEIGVSDVHRCYFALTLKIEFYIIPWWYWFLVFCFSVILATHTHESPGSGARFQGIIYSAKRASVFHRCIKEDKGCVNTKRVAYTKLKYYTPSPTCTTRESRGKPSFWVQFLENMYLLSILLYLNFPSCV